VGEFNSLELHIVLFYRILSAYHTIGLPSIYRCDFATVMAYDLSANRVDESFLGASSDFGSLKELGRTLGVYGKSSVHIEDLLVDP